MPVNQMVIDLRLCVGCGTCAIACKLGNNTQIREKGQSFNWADFVVGGPTSNTPWLPLPVKCNHCDDPICVQACPVEPITDSNCVGGTRKAMYKLTDANGGLVLHDDSRCIGCRRCQRACPYSLIDMGAYKAQASVLSYNFSTPQSQWYSDRSVLPDDVVSYPAEVTYVAGATPPHRTTWDPEGPTAGNATPDIRVGNIVEKCYGCYQRVLDSKYLPYCVQACPSRARKIVDNTNSYSNDQGDSFAPTLPTDPNVDDALVLSALPSSGLRVLAHYSMGKPVLVEPYTVGTSRPQTYYWGDFRP